MSHLCCRLEFILLHFTFALKEPRTNSKSFPEIEAGRFFQFSFYVLIASHNFIIAPSSPHWQSSLFWVHDGIESICLLFSVRISFPSWLFVVESLIDSTPFLWSHILLLTSFHDDGNVKFWVTVVQNLRNIFRVVYTLMFYSPADLEVGGIEK